MKQPPVQIPKIVDCARCGQTHFDLTFQPLTRPIDSGDRFLTHWCSCPANGEPILMRILQTTEDKKPHEVVGYRKDMLDEQQQTCEREKTTLCDADLGLLRKAQVDARTLEILHNYFKENPI